MFTFKRLLAVALVLSTLTAISGAARARTIWQQIDERAPLADVFEKLRENAP